MRIVSLNAWGGTLFDELAAWLPTAGADVVCLQEVTHTPGSTGWTLFADGERSLPQRANLLADLSNVLPGYEAVFSPSDAGPVKDSQGRRRRQEFGLATFVRHGADVTARVSEFVHGEFQEHGEWPASNRPRVAQALRVSMPETRHTVHLVHLHGLRDSAGKSDTPARDRQAQRLAELVRRTRTPGDLCVVCGDLNLLPDSKTFSVLAELGLVDLVGSADTRTSRYLKASRHASYLLVSEQAAVRGFQILDAPEVSDHRPLVLDLWPHPSR